MFAETRSFHSSLDGATSLGLLRVFSSSWPDSVGGSSSLDDSPGEENHQLAH